MTKICNLIRDLRQDRNSEVKIEILNLADNIDKVVNWKMAK